MRDLVAEIIKSPEAERMRRMVTEGFYDESRVALWMFEAIGREYDDAAEWARNLKKEAFPLTCTWGLPIWEFVYGYAPDDTLPEWYRKQRLLTRKLSRPPVTPALTEQVISLLSGCPVSVEENIAAYTFRLVIDGTGTTIHDIPGARKALCDIKQSHMSFSFETITPMDPKTIHTKAMGLGCVMETKLPYMDKPEVRKDIHASGAGFGSVTDTELPYVNFKEE